jgi:hypothetical protein
MRAGCTMAYSVGCSQCPLSNLGEGAALSTTPGGKFAASRCFCLKSRINKGFGDGFR